MTWMTILVGVLFFLTGLISCVVYYIEKEKAARRAARAETEEGTAQPPSFPVAGIGNMLLGIILALMPDSFITWVVYILAALLILGAVSQLMSLSRSRQYAHVPFYFWLFPTVILVVAILVISKPIEAAALPLMIVGWTLMCYGVIELALLIRLHHVRKADEKTEEAKIVTGSKMVTDNIEDAEIVEE